MDHFLVAPLANRLCCQHEMLQSLTFISTFWLSGFETSVKLWGPRHHFVQSCPSVTWGFETLRGEGTCSTGHRAEPGLKARFSHISSHALHPSQPHTQTTAALPDPPRLRGRSVSYCMHFRWKLHQGRGLGLFVYLRSRKVPGTSWSQIHTKWVNCVCVSVCVSHSLSKGKIFNNQNSETGIKMAWLPTTTSRIYAFIFTYIFT